MLRFDQGNLRFNYRSVAVLLNETKVLIHTTPKRQILGFTRRARRV